MNLRLFGFNRLFAGSIGIATSVSTALFSLDRFPHPMAREIRTKYPFATYGAAVVNLMVMYLSFRHVLFFALVVLVPIAFWILHASMRSRGIKNKVGNKLEQMGAQVYANTPMGLVLTTLGLEARDLEE